MGNASIVQEALDIFFSPDPPPDIADATGPGIEPLARARDFLETLAKSVTDPVLAKRARTALAA